MPAFWHIVVAAIAMSVVDMLDRIRLAAASAAAEYTPTATRKPYRFGYTVYLDTGVYRLRGSGLQYIDSDPHRQEYGWREDIRANAW